MASEQRSALILGVTGQDGALLARHLLERDWVVHGGFRRGEAGKLWRLEEMGLLQKVRLHSIDIQEPHQILEAFAALKPEQIHHLAGESFVSDSFNNPNHTLQVNTLGTLNVLEAIRIATPTSRLFYASSSEVFGQPAPEGLLDEDSPRRPLNPYGLSKLGGQTLLEIYRNHHGLKVASGMLFNHESPYRARNFVTRKITYNLARLKVDGGDPMQLGALEAARDWGCAQAYVAAMPRLLDQDAPRDCVFATGRRTSIQSFLTVAAQAAGFDPVFEGEGLKARCLDRTSGRVLMTVSEKYYRKVDTPALIGNPHRLVSLTGCETDRPIEAIATEMVAADIDRRKAGRVSI